MVFFGILFTTNEHRFSGLFLFLLTFYLHSANRMPKELEIGVLLVFSLILSLIAILCLIQ